jgi:exonuclease VII small subunit
LQEEQLEQIEEKVEQARADLRAGSREIKKAKKELNKAYDTGDIWTALNKEDDLEQLMESFKRGKELALKLFPDNKKDFDI